MRNVARILGLLVLVTTLPVPAADPPDRMNYQGVLRNAANEPIDGSVAMTFRLFDAPSGGSEVLVDAHPSVTVSGGLFNVEIGGGTLSDGSGPGIFRSLTAAFSAYPNLHLEVVVQGETLSPRTPIASAGYAWNARTVRGVEIVSDGPLDLWVDGAFGDDANDGLSPATAKETIQAAVEAVPLLLGGTATIHIAAGTYRESVWIDRRGMRRNASVIVLEGEGTPSWPPTPLVVLDGEGVRASGIQVVGFAEIRHVAITGFTDSGIEVGYGGATIEACRVETAGNENGIGIFFSEVVLRDSIVANGSGGGPAIEASRGDLQVGRAEITADGTAVILIGSSSLCFCETGPLTILSSGADAVAADNSAASFEGRADLCLGSLSAAHHSSIIGYGNDGCSVSCNADPNSFSVCQP